MRLKIIYYIVTMIIAGVGMTSCSHSEVEDVRMPDDLVGIWSPADDTYLEFGKDYSVHKLDIEYQDDMSIGLWTVDAYMYEPGYHLVVYLAGTKVYVYQVIHIDATQLTWCLVKTIEVEDVEGTESIGKVLGEIIKEAQEGFHLDPELYETLKKIPEEEFLDIIDKLDIDYPWW